MDNEVVNIPEPGNIVLATATIEVSMAEKATVEGVAVFADAWTVEAAEKGLKTYLEAQLLREGILAEVKVNLDGVSQEPEEFEEEDTIDGEFSTDSDLGDETEVPVANVCCNIDTHDPCSDCPLNHETTEEEEFYITLKLTPAEAAAVRVLTGHVTGQGTLRDAVSSVWNALCAFTGENRRYRDEINSAIISAVSGCLSANTSDHDSFQTVVSAYEQTLKNQQADLGPVQRMCVGGPQPNGRVM